MEMRREKEKGKIEIILEIGKRNHGSCMGYSGYVKKCCIASEKARHKLVFSVYLLAEMEYFPPIIL